MCIRDRQWTLHGQQNPSIYFNESHIFYNIHSKYLVRKIIDGWESGVQRQMEVGILIPTSDVYIYETLFITIDIRESTAVEITV